MSRSEKEWAGPDATRLRLRGEQMLPGAHAVSQLAAHFAAESRRRAHSCSQSSRLVPVAGSSWHLATSLVPLLVPSSLERAAHRDCVA